MSTASTGPGRILSLDQYRGYTVFGMLAVNFLGGYAGIPEAFGHHKGWVTYADMIMPQFFFAVGFGFRMSYLRRAERDGVGGAIRHAFGRNLGLILLGVLYYHLDGEYRSWEELSKLGASGFFATAFQREPFQTLVHIGIASLWVLPVIGLGVGARFAFLTASLMLHAWLSAWFYFDWVMHRPGIDGGPLGFLTWAIPILVGSLACDIYRSASLARGSGRMVALGLILMTLGYAMTWIGGGPGSAPFIPGPTEPTLWGMSQRSGSSSYQVFASGFSVATFALFAVACDSGAGRGLGIFRTLGRNALIAYFLHGFVAGALKPWCPKDAPLIYTLAIFSLYVLITWWMIRQLEKWGVTLAL